MGSDWGRCGARGFCDCAQNDRGGGAQAAGGAVSMKLWRADSLSTRRWMFG
jgi:hypothetical protein